MSLYNNIIRYILAILLAVLPCASTLAQVDNAVVADGGEAADESDSLYIPKTLQQKIDSILCSEYQSVSYRTTTVRGRNGRRKTIRQKTKVANPLTAGCCVYNLSADSIIYEHNEEQMMTPASTQKVFVATAMLEKYGINYTFNTKVMTDGSIREDSLGRFFLDGDIIVHGGTDPLFGKEYTDSIYRAIKKIGVDSIAGRILVYESPRYDHIKLHEEDVAPLLAKKLMADSICFADEKPWATTKDVSVLSCRNTILKISTTLDQVLKPMMKKSNNNCAQAMLLNLMPDDARWDYQSCCDVVRSTITRILSRVNDQHDLQEVYNIIDGSGLSHSNKTTAQTQVDLLRYIYRKSSLYQTLREYLPIAGVDGTLSKRMTQGKAYNNVRAKTGTVNKVKTLCGYLSAANNDLIAFSILIGNNNDERLAVRMQNSICELLANME